MLIIINKLVSSVLLPSDMVLPAVVANYITITTISQMLKAD